MLNEHLLWTRIIQNDGRLQKEPTFLGASLLFVAICAGFYALIFLGAAL
jgi:hypothetical protein